MLFRCSSLEILMVFGDKNVGQNIPGRVGITFSVA